MDEVLGIREQLKAYSPCHVIWDIEDLQKKPPWGDNISEEITDLSNYFVTADGVQVFDRLISALEDSIRMDVDVYIRSI